MVSQSGPISLQEAPSSADEVIRGAGMAGICTAYFLAKNGVSNVLLVDKRYPLSLTSDKSAETFRVWWPGETNRDKFALLNRSVDLIEQIVHESEGMLHMQPKGHCHVTACASKVTAFQQTAQEYATLGLGPLRVYSEGVASEEEYLPPSRAGQDILKGVDLLLDRKLIEAHLAYLPEDTIAIIHDRRSGYFSGHTLGMLLLEKAKALGVRELRAEVVDVEQDAQGVCAVKVSGAGGTEVVQTRAFVNAAGPFVRRVAAMLDVDFPVVTGLWEKIVIDAYFFKWFRSALLLVLHDPQRLEWTEEEAAMWREDQGYRWLLDELADGVYIRPEGSAGGRRVLIGWAYNDCPYGREVDFGEDVGREGAGAACEPCWEPQLSREFPELALRAAVKLVPGFRPYLDRLPKPMHDGGQFVKTEFEMPLIGPLGVDGAFVVQHDGMVMAGCASGELCAAWVVGGQLPDYAAGLTLDGHRKVNCR